MPAEQLLPMVLVVVGVWLTLAFAAVSLVRALYARWVARLMRERVGLDVTLPLPVWPNWQPPFIARYATELPSRAGTFSAQHRKRFAVYAVGAGVFACVYGVAWVFRVAIVDQRFEFLRFATSPEMLVTASKWAIFPLVGALVLLSVRRLHHQASGIWVASLILIACPLGKLSLEMTAGRWLGVGFRAALGVLLAWIYLRINAWRAGRSGWSFPARALNAFFLTFGLIMYAFSALAGKWWLGLLFLIPPYIAYALTLRLLFAIIGLPPRQRLLFLRVFGRQAQVDRLYRTLVYDWTTIGPVRLIGAPDLAQRTLNPQLLTAFVNGSLRQLFQWQDADLVERVKRADKALIDRSYRTLEVLCSGETWRLAVKRLVQDVDVVVMDLRGFGETNRGCAWELGQLVNEVPLSRVLLCVDRQVNHAALHAALLAAWQSIVPSSPNWRSLEPFQLLHVEDRFESVAAAALALANRRRLGQEPSTRAAA